MDNGNSNAKMIEKTKEPQYNTYIRLRNSEGLARLGVMMSHDWHTDPKHLLFNLSRYKFVAKMLSGKDKVLEVGCGDAFCSRIVQSEVKSLTAVDFDPIFIQDAKDRMDSHWKFDLRVHDMTMKPVNDKFDAVYSIDVLEHIPKDKEDSFIRNMMLSLNTHGLLIIGTPSIYSQPYASSRSKEGHVNCKSYEEIKKLLEKCFYQVIIFCMNDELIHTGFNKMSHYYFAICSERKR
jgi:cyclopropane fatty-acyl-phospholipid synthase-like methyltransferase